MPLSVRGTGAGLSDAEIDARIAARAARRTGPNRIASAASLPRPM